MGIVGLVAFTFALVVISVALGGFLSKIHTAVKNKKRSARVSFLGFVGVIACVAMLWFYRGQITEILPSAPEKLSILFSRWDFLLFLMLSSFHLAANIEVKDASAADKTIASIPAQTDTDFSQRKFLIDLFNYAAMALKDTSSSYISAVSILIPASFVIVQVSKPAPPALASANVASALPFVFRGVVWFLFSLICGIVVLYVVSMYGRYRDLTRSLFVAAFLGFQFYSLGIGVLCLVTGLYYVVFS